MRPAGSIRTTPGPCSRTIARPDSGRFMRSAQGRRTAQQAEQEGNRGRRAHWAGNSVPSRSEPAVRILDLEPGRKRRVGRRDYHAPSSSAWCPRVGQGPGGGWRQPRQAAVRVLPIAASAPPLDPHPAPPARTSAARRTAPRIARASSAAARRVLEPARVVARPDRLAPRHLHVGKVAAAPPTHPARGRSYPVTAPRVPAGSRRSPPAPGDRPAILPVRPGHQDALHGRRGSSHPGRAHPLTPSRRAHDRVESGRERRMHPTLQRRDRSIEHRIRQRDRDEHANPVRPRYRQPDRVTRRKRRSPDRQRGGNPKACRRPPTSWRHVISLGSVAVSKEMLKPPSNRTLPTHTR